MLSCLRGASEGLGTSFVGNCPSSIREEGAEGSLHQFSHRLIGVIRVRARLFVEKVQKFSDKRSGVRLERVIGLAIDKLAYRDRSDTPRIVEVLR